MAADTRRGDSRWAAIRCTGKLRATVLTRYDTGP